MGLRGPICSVKGSDQMVPKAIPGAVVLLFLINREVAQGWAMCMAILGFLAGSVMPRSLLFSQSAEAIRHCTMLCPHSRCERITLEGCFSRESNYNPYRRLTDVIIVFSL